MSKKKTEENTKKKEASETPQRYSSSNQNSDNDVSLNLVHNKN